jgi:hypothetical protein
MQRKPIRKGSPIVCAQRIGVFLADSCRRSCHPGPDADDNSPNQGWPLQTSSR